MVKYVSSSHVDDGISASEVLQDGYGQCNTKGTLFMALLRACYDCPDELLKEHHQEMSPLKAFVYRNIGRHLMNRNVRNIRGNMI